MSEQRPPDPAEIERRAGEIWTDVLGRAEGTFFELSGQSIAAVRIVARVEDELGIPFDLGELFNDPDRAGFVAAVRAAAENAADNAAGDAARRTA